MWRIEHDPDRSLLELRALGVLGLAELDALAEAWAKALAATANSPTVALFDLRGLEPLEGDAVDRMRARIKEPALALPNLQRLVIVVDSAINTLQQRHAMVDPERELITRDPEDARALLWPE
jgi:hypothetical protein